MKKLLVGILSFVIMLSLITVAHPQKVEAYGAQCSGYWVGMVQSSSSVTKVSCVDSYNAGILLMNQQTSTASSVASLFNADTIVASAYATLDFTTVGSVNVNSRMSAVYHDGTTGSDVDYFNGYYGAEGPYITTGSTQTSAITYISGLKAKVAKVRGSYTQYAIVPISVKAPKNYYVKETNGSVRHYFATSSGQYSLSIGVAPTFFETSKIYYSPDGHYFYLNYMTMIDDLNAGVFTHAINSVPWYNYYQFLPFHSSTNYSAADIDNYFKKVGFTNLAYTAYNVKLEGMGLYPLDNESVLVNSGSYFMQMQQIYGINPLLLMAISINETGWGQSYIAIVKNNIFGMAAYDSSTGSATSYSSIVESVYDAAKVLTSNYLTSPKDSSFYNGSFLGNKSGGVNVYYASDPYWGEKAAAYYYQFDLSMGFKDYNTYAIGVTNSDVVKVYSSPSTSSTYIYNFTGTKHKVYGSTVLITGESGDFYQIMPDISLSSAVNWTSNGFTSEYSMEDNHAYVKKSDITISNGKTSFVSPKNSEAINKLRIEFLYEFYTLKTTASTPVYSDAYLTNSTGISLASDSYLVASERSYTSSKDFSYKVIIDLKTGNTGWISADNVTEVTGTYAYKYNAKHDAIQTPIYSSAGGSSKVSYVTYNNEYISIISSTTVSGSVWYQVTYNPITGATGWTPASGYGKTYSHTAPEIIDPPQPPEPSILPGIEDLSRIDNMYYLDQIKLNSEGNAVTIRGLLALSGVTNSPSTNMAFELLLINETTNAQVLIPLDRWLDTDEYPFNVNSVPGVKKDYSGAWFEGTLDFSDIPDGNYSMTLVAKNSTYYTTAVLTNTFSIDIAQRFTNSSGTGIELRTNYLLKTMPLELMIRSEGLLTNSIKPTLDNGFIEYTTLGLADGKLNIKGTAFNVNGEYKANSTIERTIVFENITTYERFSFAVGSTDNGDYKITLRVPDGLDKTRAWFQGGLDISALPTGTYAIYVLTTSDNGLVDYGELTDSFCRDLNTSMTYGDHNYSLLLNTNKRFRIELIID